MNTLTRKFTTAFALVATFALMAVAAPVSAQQDKELPPNAIGLVKGDVIKFHNSAAGLSPEERVSQFWNSLRNAYGAHIRNHDDEVERGDIELNYNSELDIYHITFHDEILVEVTNADARNYERSQRALAENWARLLRRHIVNSQPDHDEEVVF